MNPKKTETVPIATITRAVASHYGLSPEQLRARSRHAAITKARQMAGYLCRELSGAGLKTIAVHLYGAASKHSTVVTQHAVVRHSADMEQRRAAKELATTIRKAART